MQCRMHELRNKERISVAAASKILANIVYEYKGRGLSMVSGVGLADRQGAVTGRLIVGQSVCVCVCLGNDDLWMGQDRKSTFISLVCACRLDEPGS
jgi:20S proteasome alpha/beta subunit